MSEVARPTDYASIGRNVATLLYEPSWVHRRKDSVELLGDTWVRRQTSVDFTVPGDSDPLIGESIVTPESLHVVPLAVLPKAPGGLMKFDLKDEGGRSLPLPTRQQNALASFAAMIFAAADALDGVDPQDVHELPLILARELAFVAWAPPAIARDVADSLLTGGTPELPDGLDEVPSPSDASRALRRWVSHLCGTERIQLDDEGEDETNAGFDPGVADHLVDFREHLANDPVFAWLVNLFAGSAVVVALVAGGTGNRRLVRLSYHQAIFKKDSPRTLTLTQRLGWRPLPFVVSAPYAAASSYHFEFTACAGVEANASVLLLNGEDVPSLNESYEDEPRRGNRAHLYVPDARDVDEVTAHIELRVQREGFIASAAVASVGIVAVLLGFTIAADAVVENGTSAPSALLLFPGLLATLVSRAGGDVLVIRMLQYARWALLAAGGTAYVAAFALFVTTTGSGHTAPPELRVTWGALCGIAAVAAAVLVVARQLPRPTASRLDVVVEGTEDLVRRVMWRRDRWRTRHLVFSLGALPRPQLEALANRLDGTCVGLRVRPRPWRLVRRIPNAAWPRPMALARAARHPREWWRSLPPRTPDEVRLRVEYGGRPLLSREVTAGDRELRLRSRLVQPPPRDETSVHAERAPAEALANTSLGLRDILGPEFDLVVSWGRLTPTTELRMRWEEFSAACAAGQLEAGAVYSLSAAPPRTAANS